MKNVLIFGDSYSTHKDGIPNGFRSYYCNEGRVDGPAVTKMQIIDTWWYKIVSKIGANLVQNNSFSGSTISYTDMNGNDCSKTNSFIYRLKKLESEGFFKANNVDTVFIFGATNDSWFNVPLGKIQTCNFKKEDLFCILPAICYFCLEIRRILPNAQIYFIKNTSLKEEIVKCIDYVSKICNIVPISLHNVEKESGHPTVNGMNAIFKQVLTEYLKCQ